MWLRYILVGLILFLILAVNLPEGLIFRLGMAPNVLLATLCSIVVTGLIAHRHLLLIALVLVCAAGANLPASVASQWGINRDILLATLVGLVIMPFVAGNDRHR